MTNNQKNYEIDPSLLCMLSPLNNSISRGDVAQIRKMAKKLIRQINKTVESNKKILKKIKKLYGFASKGEIENQLKSFPLWRLREYGASGARTSSLEKAGYTSAWDIHISSERQIRSVHGVGDKSAAAVKAAATEVYKETKTTVTPDLKKVTPTVVELMRYLCIFLYYENHVGPVHETLDRQQSILRRQSRNVAPLSRWWQRPFLSKEKIVLLEEEVIKIIFEMDKVATLGVIDQFHQKQRSFLNAPPEELHDYVIGRYDQFVPLLTWVGKRPLLSGEGSNQGVPHIYTVVERSVASGVQILYHMYDANEVLLYVGITNHLERRLKEHSEEKPWFQKIQRIEVERFATRKDVEYAERNAIISEKPLHNITFNNG